MLINTPEGQLEIAIDKIDDNKHHRWAIVCHPHPLFGGTMNNKVVTTTSKALQLSGYSVIRFNFRGVGQSSGGFDEGRGELQDLHAVFDWLSANETLDTLCLAGFSFGSYIAFQASQTLPCKQLILIAPPIMRFNYQLSEGITCPCLIIQGDEDEIVDPQQVIAWAKTLEKSDPQFKLIIMEKSGHFFHGKLIELRNTLKDYLCKD